MIIFRVETEQGKGMYNVTIPSMQDLTEGDASDRHPLPWDDSRLERRCAALGLDVYALPDTFRFGFRDYAQMRNWLHLDRWLEYLHGVGFVLSLYDVPYDACADGHSQLVFDLDAAELIEQRSLV